jgi:hypothetical protein
MQPDLQQASPPGFYMLAFFASSFFTDALLFFFFFVLLDLSVSPSPYWLSDPSLFSSSF